MTIILPTICLRLLSEAASSSSSHLFVILALVNCTAAQSTVHTSYRTFYSPIKEAELLLLLTVNFSGSVRLLNYPTSHRWTHQGKSYLYLIMVVRIRLQRMGQRNLPFYRIVVADARAPRDGKFIENVRQWLPATSLMLIQFLIRFLFLMIRKFDTLDWNIQPNSYEVWWDKRNNS